MASGRYAADQTAKDRLGLSPSSDGPIRGPKKVIGTHAQQLVDKKTPSKAPVEVDHMSPDSLHRRRYFAEQTPDSFGDEQNATPAQAHARPFDKPSQKGVMPEKRRGMGLVVTEQLAGLADMCKQAGK